MTPGHVAALVMIIGASFGGYAGAHFARRIGKEKARIAGRDF